MAETDATEGQEQARAVEVSDAQLPEVDDSGVKAPLGQINILLDTAISISASLGDVEIKARDLLELGPGSVLKLDKRAGEPIDLYLRGIKFASGALVVVGENLGVRINEIIPADEAADQVDSNE